MLPGSKIRYTCFVLYFAFLLRTQISTMANKGLQPVNLFLAIFPSVCCVMIVSVRIVLRLKGGRLGVGEFVQWFNIHFYSHTTQKIYF